MSKQDYDMLIGMVCNYRLSVEQKFEAVKSAFEKESYTEGYSQYDNQEYSLIEEIIELGQIANDLLIKLIDEGIDYQIKTRHSKKHIIHSLARYGLLEPLEYLLQKEPGINIDPTDDIGCTPFHISATVSNIKSMEFLFEHGANINARRKSGWTPLKSVCHSRYKEAIEWLLLHGAEDVPDNDGNTALMIPNWSGDPHSVGRGGEELATHLYIDYLLIIYGADVFFKNKNGKTAFDIQKDESRKKQLCAAMYVWNEIMGEVSTDDLLLYHNNNSIMDEDYRDLVQTLRDVIYSNLLSNAKLLTRIVDKISRGLELSNLEKKYIGPQGIEKFIQNGVKLLNNASLFMGELPHDLVLNIISFPPKEDAVKFLSHIPVHLKWVESHLKSLSEYCSQSSISADVDAKSKPISLLEAIPSHLIENKSTIIQYIDNLKGIKHMFGNPNHLDHLCLIALNQVLGNTIRINYRNYGVYTISGENSILDVYYTGSGYSFSDPQIYHKLIEMFYSDTFSVQEKFEAVKSAFEKESYTKGYSQYDNQEYSLIEKIIELGPIANDLLIKLIDEGIDYQIKTRYSKEHIMHALVRHGLLKVLEYLLEKEPEIKIDTTDDIGRTPFYYSAIVSNIEAMELLLKYGANINARNEGGSTPLKSVCYLRYKKIIEYLLEKGADPDLPDNDGMTPLMIRNCGRADLRPVGMKGEELASRVYIDYLLMRNGANLFFKNKNGQTAFDIQRDYNRKIQLLSAMSAWKEVIGENLGLNLLISNVDAFDALINYIEYKDTIINHWKTSTELPSRIVHKTSMGFKLSNLEKQFLNAPKNDIMYQEIQNFIIKHVSFLNNGYLFPDKLPNEIMQSIILFLPNEDAVKFLSPIPLHLEWVESHLKSLSKCRAKSSISGHVDEESKAISFLEAIPNNLIKNKSTIIQYIDNLKDIKPIFCNSNLDHLCLIALNQVLGAEICIDYGDDRYYRILGKKTKLYVDYEFGNPNNLNDASLTDLNNIFHKEIPTGSGDKRLYTTLLRTSEIAVNYTGSGYSFSHAEIIKTKIKNEVNMPSNEEQSFVRNLGEVSNKKPSFVKRVSDPEKGIINLERLELIEQSFKGINKSSSDTEAQSSPSKPKTWQEILTCALNRYGGLSI